MKRLVVVLCVLCAAVLLPAATVASPGPKVDSGPQTAASACDDGTLVVNIKQTVLNDIDSGFSGYWAIDTYSRHIQVRQIDEMTFCAIVDYLGQFTTFAATSPGDTAAPLPAGITGTMHGGYRATITGVFDPQWATRGNLGEFDYGCDSSGEASCDRVIWEAGYFPSGYVRTLDWWGWIYLAGNNGKWVNSIDGSEGDITG